MKNTTLRWLISSLLVIGAVIENARGQEQPARPATQAEVNAGTVTKKFVSPATLTSWTGAVGGGATNLIVQTNSSGVKTGYTTLNFAGFTGVASGSTVTLTPPASVLGTSNLFNVGQFTNSVTDTNTLYITGAGSNIVNQVYYWNAGLVNYTNAVNDVVIIFSTQWKLTNSVGQYYRKATSPAGNWVTTGSIGSTPVPTGTFGTNIVIATNTSSGWTTSFPVNDFKGVESYVTTLGDDSTGKRGSKQFPFRTINIASTNMQPGDVLRIDAGNFYPTNAIFPANVAIIGSGMDRTIITVGDANGFSYGFRLSNGGLVKDMTVQTTNQPVNPNLQQPIQYIGNARGENLYIIGDQDVFIFSSDNTSNYFNNCWFAASFDVFIPPTTTTNAYFELNGVHLLSVAGLNGSLTTTYGHGLVLRPGGGRLKMFGGSIEAYNSSTETFGVLADSGSSNVCDFYDVPIYAVTTNGGLVAVATNRGSATFNFIKGGVTNGAAYFSTLTTTGAVNVGASANVTNDLSVGGNLTVTGTTTTTGLNDVGTLAVQGKVTKVNGLTTWTTTMGVPAIANLTQTSFTGSSSGTNTLYTPPSNGVYRVSVYMSVTTAGTSGTLDSTIYWSDLSQAESISPAAQIVNLGAKGFSSGSAYIVATNGVAIKVGYTTGAVVGSPACRIDTTVERIQ